MNCTICQNIIFVTKVLLTNVDCAKFTKFFKLPQKWTDNDIFQQIVIHIKKALKFNKRDLYTELYTLSTVFRVYKKGFEYEWMGTSVLWSSNKNININKKPKILVDRHNVKNI